MNNRQSVFSSNSDTNPVIKALEDKSFVMTILCNDCYKHYNFCKQICIVLIIITSSIMVLLNTYDPKIYWIQYVNIIMNSINIIVISFQSKFEIVEKTKIFLDLSHQFNHLHNDIIDRVTLHPEQQNNKEYIQEYTLKYNNLQNNVIEFPDFIRNKIVDKFKNFRIIPNNLLSVFDTNIGSFVFKRERTNSRIFIRDKSPTNAISL